MLAQATLALPLNSIPQALLCLEESPGFGRTWDASPPSWALAALAAQMNYATTFDHEEIHRVRRTHSKRARV